MQCSVHWLSTFLLFGEEYIPFLISHRAVGGAARFLAASLVAAADDESVVTFSMRASGPTNLSNIFQASVRSFLCASVILCLFLGVTIRLVVRLKLSTCAI